MIVGVLKEIKSDENRVAITPAGAEIMRRYGHELMLEKGAGVASGFADTEYAQAGAQVLDAPREIFDRAQMLLRVKEPQPSEYELLREGQIYFAYLHLATSEQVTRALMKSGSIAIA